jgi:pimeloyl-ACP methyl ester carboxylesterase
MTVVAAWRKFWQWFRGLDRRWRIAIIVACGLFALYSGVIGVATRLFLSPWRFAVNRPHGVVEVNVASSRGPVPSWATSNWRSAKVVFILADGYGGSRQTFAPLMPALAKAGYGAVALSMNGHDASPDPSVGFGTKEAQTVADAVHWLRSERRDNPRVVLLGLSMGGAACWLSTEIEPNVDAVVSESAFADFPSAMNDWFGRVPGSGLVLAPAVWLVEAETGLDPASIRPVDAARRWRGRPALVISGGSDELMTPHHGVELSQAAGAPLWVVPGAHHALASHEDLPDYMAHLRSLVASLDSKARV